MCFRSVIVLWPVQGVRFQGIEEIGRGIGLGTVCLEILEGGSEVLLEHYLDQRLVQHRHDRHLLQHRLQQHRRLVCHRLAYLHGQLRPGCCLVPVSTLSKASCIPDGLTLLASVGSVAAVATSVVAAAATVATNSEFVAVILGTTLGDGHQNGLMVGSTRHGADTVVSSGQASSDGGLQVTIAIAGIVDTLEEDKLGSIQGSVGRQGVTHILNRDVNMADNGTAAAKILGSRVVGRLSVSEGAGLQVVDLELDIKVLVGLDVAVVRGVVDDGRHHLGLGGDLAHGNTVAGTASLLLTIGEGRAGANVDKVGIVAAKQLISAFRGLPVLCLCKYLRLGVGLLGVGLSGLLRTLLHRVRLQTQSSVVTSVGISTLVCVSTLVSALSATVTTTLLTLGEGGAQWRGIEEGDGGLGDDGHAREGGDELLNLHLCLFLVDRWG